MTRNPYLTKDCKHPGMYFFGDDIVAGWCQLCREAMTKDEDWYLSCRLRGGPRYKMPAKKKKSK